MIRSVGIALFLRVFGTVLWILFSIIIARSTSLEEFGLIFFAINVSLTGGGIAVMGYDVTILRYGSMFWRDRRTDEFRRLFSEAQFAVSGLGILTTAAFLLATFLGLDTSLTSQFGIALLTGLSILFTAQMAIYRDALRSAGFLQAALLGQSVMRGLFPLICCILGVLAGWLDAEFAILSYMLGLMVAIAWQHWRLARIGATTLPRPSFHHIRMAIGVWPGDVALVIFQRAAGIAVGLTSGLEAAALYLAAERIAQLGTFIMDAVRTAVGPMIAQAREEDRQRAVSQSSLLMAGSGIAGIILLLALGPIMLWLFGPEYQVAYPVLIALLFGQLSWTVFGPTALFLNMLGAQNTRSIISVASAALLLAILPFCKTAFDAAVVFAVVAWIMNLSLWILITRILKLQSGLFAISIRDVHGLISKEKARLSKMYSRLKGRKQ